MSRFLSSWGLLEKKLGLNREQPPLVQSFLHPAPKCLLDCIYLFQIGIPATHLQLEVTSVMAGQC